MISIVIPIYDMQDGDKFLWRNINSIMEQTYKNYEIIITKAGKMAENTNAGIRKCRGDIVKILFMDDYFAHPNALQEIADNFDGGWLATGCNHDDGLELFNPHLARWNFNIHAQNTIGSPSVIAFENHEPLLFDENLSWVLDCDLYKRLYERYGEPTIIDDINVTIGVGRHQTTHIMSDEEKSVEEDTVRRKYGKI